VVDTRHVVMKSACCLSIDCIMAVIFFAVSPLFFFSPLPRCGRSLAECTENQTAALVHTTECGYPHQCNPSNTVTSCYQRPPNRSNLTTAVATNPVLLSGLQGPIVLIRRSYISAMFYYQLVKGTKNYEDSIKRVQEYLQKAKIPVRWYQFDSWCYRNGTTTNTTYNGDGGVLDWLPLEDMNFLGKDVTLSVAQVEYGEYTTDP